MTISTILLVPAKGDITLLADEPGGGKVPAMTREYMGGWVLGAVYGVEQALLLAYAGKSVPMGTDRAARRCPGWWKDTPARINHWLAGDMTASYLIDPHAPNAPRVVLLDADGREVTRG